MLRMLSTNALVSIYLGEVRPLNVDMLMIILEFSGLVARGHRSMQFWVYWTRPVRPSRARRFDGRFPRLRR